LCDEQNHKALPENTKDTIQKKIFLKVLSCICIFVFESKKSQPKDNIDSNTENNNLDKLDTNANRHEGQSNQELALIVNTAFIESLQKAEKKKKLAKKKKRTSQHEKSI
jgi:hypothetical protein